MDDTASKIKSLCTFTGQAVKELSFSSPALVTGLTKLPSAGAPFQSYSDRKQAEATAAKQKMATKTKTAPTNTATPNSERVTVPIILKTDVTGSLAAVEHILSQLQTDKVELKVVEMGIGPIAENDIKLAGASTASLVLGFNVKATKAALELAEHNQVNIQTFDIIYKLSEWLAEEIKKRTPLVQVETTIGEAKILKIFSVQKSKQVLGGQVQDGKLVEGKVVKILRRGQEIGKGRISELQQQKARIKEVEAGKQFGALIEAKTVIAVGDTIVASDIITQ